MCVWPRRRLPAASVVGDFGDDDATLALGATWRRENPELAEKLQTDRVVRLPPTASGTNNQPTRAAP